MISLLKWTGIFTKVILFLKNKPGCNGHEQSEVKWKTGLQLR